MPLDLLLYCIHLLPCGSTSFIDNLQFHAIRRALTLAAVPHGAMFLDVGCGTGRWVRRYGELGYSPTGVDATRGMLQMPRARNTTAPLVEGLAQSLPFSDQAFDCVSDITVIQHIPYELRPKALGESLPRSGFSLLNGVREHSQELENASQDRCYGIDNDLRMGAEVQGSP